MYRYTICNKYDHKAPQDRIGDKKTDRVSRSCDIRPVLICILILLFPTKRYTACFPGLPAPDPRKQSFRKCRLLPG